MSFLSFAIFLRIISFIGRYAFKFIMGIAVVRIALYILMPREYKSVADEFTMKNSDKFFEQIRKISNVSIELAKKGSSKLENELKEMNVDNVQGIEKNLNTNNLVNEFGKQIKKEVNK